MAGETTARVQTQQRDAPGEDEYQTFCAALSASARGRAFLAEYLRRSRNTGPLLTAIERLHSTLAPSAATPSETLIKQNLRALLDDIAIAQSELEASIQAIRSAKLAELISIVEQRLREIMSPARDETALAAELSPAADQALPEDERSHLAVVPQPEQPELPIPAPMPVQQPPIALVRADPAMAEVAFIDSPSPGSSKQPETRLAPTAFVASQAEPDVARTTSPADPLASIMTLSEDERLALFT